MCARVLDFYLGAVCCYTGLAYRCLGLAFGFDVSDVVVLGVDWCLYFRGLWLGVVARLWVWCLGVGGSLFL